MCGDHSLKTGIFTQTAGSPPHVRGPLYKSVSVVCCYGITPACAGTTIYEELNVSIMGDHPRMCGDHDVNHFVSFVSKGSPPHVRGPLLTNPLL